MVVKYKTEKSKNIYKFGDLEQDALGSIRIRAPISEDHGITKQVDVVPVDVPFLIGLDLLDKYGLFINNVDNLLRSTKRYTPNCPQEYHNNTSKIELMENAMSAYEWSNRVFSDYYRNTDDFTFHSICTALDAKYLQVSKNEKTLPGHLPFFGKTNKECMGTQKPGTITSSTVTRIISSTPTSDATLATKKVTFRFTVLKKKENCK